MEFSGKSTKDESGQSGGKILNKKKAQKKRSKKSKKVLSLVFPYLRWNDLLTSRLVSKCWNTEARQRLSNCEQPMLKFQFSRVTQSYLTFEEEEDDDDPSSRNKNLKIRSLSKFLQCFSSSSASSSSSNNNIMPYNTFGFIGGDWDTADLRQFWDQFGSNVKKLELGFDNDKNKYACLAKFWDILNLDVPNLSHLILDHPPTSWQNLTGPPPHLDEISLSSLKTIELEEYKSYKEHSNLIMALVGFAPNLENLVNFQFSLLNPFSQANKLGLVKNLEVTHPTYFSEHHWNLQQYFMTWKKFLDCAESSLKLEKIVIVPDSFYYSDNEKVKSEFAKMLKKVLKNCQNTLKEMALFPVPGVLDQGSVPVLPKLKTLKLYEFDLCIKGQVGQNILVKGSRLARVMPNLEKVQLIATEEYMNYEHEDGKRYFHPCSTEMDKHCVAHPGKELTGVFTVTDSDSEDEEEMEDQDTGFFPSSVKRLEVLLVIVDKAINHEMKPLLRNLSRLFVNINSLRVSTFDRQDSLGGMLKSICTGWTNLGSLEVGAMIFDVGKRIPGKTWKSKRVMKFNGLSQPIDLDRLRREWPLSSLENLKFLDITRTEIHFEEALGSSNNFPGYCRRGPDNFNIGQAVGKAFDSPMIKLPAKFFEDLCF